MQNVIDKKTGLVEKLIKKTANSYLVTRTKLTEHGVTCDNWFTTKDLHDNFYSIKTFAEHVLVELDKNPSDFAKKYVEFRTKSYNVFHNGLVVSSSHGADYFKNVVKHFDNPTEWSAKPDSKAKPDYEYNFTLVLLNNKI